MKNTWANKGLLILVASGVGGCHEFPDVTLDDLPPSGMVSTASSEDVRRQHVEGVVRVRDFAPRTARSQDGTVVHGPLWLEDPFEILGSEDGQFARTWEEVIYFFPIGVGRFVGNVLLLPLSMFVDLPGSVMCSDGTLDERSFAGVREMRDSAPCSGATEPPDVHALWSTIDEFADAEHGDRMETDDSHSDGDSPNHGDE